MKLYAIALALGLTMVSTAAAESLRSQYGNQRQRIYQGMRSGELTRSEASRLHNRSAELRRDYVRDRRDGGGLSRWERRRLDARQDSLGRSIYRQKHDRQDRW